MAALVARWDGDVDRAALIDRDALKRDPYLLLSKLAASKEIFQRFGIKARVATASFGPCSVNVELVLSM